MAVFPDLDEVGGGMDVPPLNRMGVALLGLGGFFVALYMLLYSAGLIGTLACGPAGGCDVVQASSWSVFLGVPVPLWGVVGYSLIVGVALASIRPRWLADRRISIALLALAATAVAFSAYLSAISAFVIGAWCRWCVVSALLATAIFALALPELRRLRVTSGR